MRVLTILLIIKKNIQIYFLRSLNLSPRPYKVLIQLTNDCNSKCESCGIWKINKDNPSLKKQEINRNHIESLLKDLNKDLIWLSISGGEPTLSPHLLETVKLAQELCPNLRVVTFTTNAIQPQKVLEVADQIKKYNLDFFVVLSMDGDSDLHDSIRGSPGNFSKVWKTYKALKNNNIHAYLGLTLSQLNADFVIHSFHHLKNDIKSISFVHSEGIYGQNNSTAFTSKVALALKRIIFLYKIDHLSQLVEYLYIRIAEKFMRFDRKKILVPCSVLDTSIHIWPNGDVSPCMFLPSLGNIKNDSWKKIQNSEDAFSSRKIIKQGKCPNCWMNCYAPHSMMLSPFKAIYHALLK